MGRIHDEAIEAEKWAREKAVQDKAREVAGKLDKLQEEFNMITVRSNFSVELEPISNQLHKEITYWKLKKGLLVKNEG